ncbi:hypothetical protein [Xanthomonas arboricola]|uniref:ParB/Sulfiredoxin domain-containing protein n=1 Tax=Xanthomonas arboricola TaxID=56448 RepID=A0AB73H2E6_9XANT|nr:hypothetical protein [Xanthomonas arboricola]MBB5672351.1 hypothetical protein [Xanthomonas arboricola]
MLKPRTTGPTTAVPKFNWMALLPHDVEALLGLSLQAVYELDTVLTRGDNGAMAQDKIDAIKQLLAELRPELPHDAFERHTQATPGAIPSWGQAGEFVMEVEGIRVHVQCDAAEVWDGSQVHLHFQYNSVDLDRPFFSETGFRSHFVHWPVHELAGMTQLDVARTEYLRLRNPPSPKVKPLKLRPLDLDSRRRLSQSPLASWLANLSPAPNRTPTTLTDNGTAMTDISEDQLHLDLPADTFDGELNPGGMKAVKMSARRSDAFVFLAPERLIVQPSLNVRVRSQTYIDRVRGLADAMKVQGFRIDRPISCYVEARTDAGGMKENVVVVADGHTRLEAVHLARAEGADLSEIPVCLLPGSTSMDDVLAGLVVSNSGCPLTMLEQSIVVKRLQHRGYSNAEIGRKVGNSGAYVDTLTVLAAAPVYLQQLVASERIAGTTVVALIREVGPTKAVERVAAEQERLMAAGKADAKLRPKQLEVPGIKASPAVRRAAVRLYDAVNSIKGDPGFDQLSDANRALIDMLLDTITSDEAKRGAGKNQNLASRFAHELAVKKGAANAA